ncbi:DNA-binding protein SMUBP-2 [Tylopilus felleus]
MYRQRGGGIVKAVLSESQIVLATCHSAARMHALICQFPSKTLYASKLRSHDCVSSHLLSDLPNTTSFAEIMDEETVKETLGNPVVFFDTAGCRSGSVSFPEDRVITPYQAQVTLLGSLLCPEYGAELEIGTVDGMQGREKDAVIISLVRSNDKREVGFSKEKRRMNVAMIRAKRHLCIIGDSSTVRHGGPYLKKWLAWLETNADVRFPEA